MAVKPVPNFTSTRNACKLCAPLGASLAFRGVESTVPYLHGSQGCATYIRRYMIGHFKEPVDIASSSFNESAAIFGGSEHFKTGVNNVIRQYNPKMVGVATTCLSETIGDDISMFLHEYKKNAEGDLPLITHVSTPSYSGTHAEGFFATVRAIVETCAKDGKQQRLINCIPGMISPEDIRYLRDLFSDFDIPAVILPDYSDTLDGPIWDEYQRIPEGGTPIASIETMGSATSTVEFSTTYDAQKTAGAFLEQTYQVKNYRMDLPIGVEACDRFIQAITESLGVHTRLNISQSAVVWSIHILTHINIFSINERFCMANKIL
jgi:nitrogenase molybdenum-iron protein NifN